MPAQTPLDESLMLSVNAHFALLARLSEHQVLILDAEVDRLRVIYDLAGLPRRAVRVRVSLGPRPFATGPQGQELFTGGHAPAIVRKGTDVFEFLIKQDDILSVRLVICQGRPDQIGLDRGDGIRSATGGQGLLQGLCLLLKGSGKVSRLPTVSDRRAPIGAALKSFQLHLHCRQAGAQRRVATAKSICAQRGRSGLLLCSGACLGRRWMPNRGARDGRAQHGLGRLAGRLRRAARHGRGEGGRGNRRRSTNSFRRDVGRGAPNLIGASALLAAEGNDELTNPENRLLIVINRTDRNFTDIDLQRFR